MNSNVSKSKFKPNWFEISTTNLEGWLPTQSSNSLMEGLEYSPGKKLLGLCGASLLLNEGLGGLPSQYNGDGFPWGYLSVHLLFPLLGFLLFQLLNIKCSASAWLSCYPIRWRRRERLGFGFGSGSGSGARCGHSKLSCEYYSRSLVQPRRREWVCGTRNWSHEFKFESQWYIDRYFSFPFFFCSPEK